jgi:hypothetical protein
MATITLAPLVVIESPYAGDVRRNIEYARLCMRDSLLRGEIPIASHLLYTQSGILDDDNPVERNMGINAGFEWGKHADFICFYTDLDWSRGMLKAKEYWTKEGKPIVERHLNA